MSVTTPSSPRRTHIVSWVMLLVASVLLLTGGSQWAGATAANADPNDFSYDSWAVDYRIGTDDAGRAEAHVTETITAVFPDFDQNRGIVRGLPDRYEGTQVRLRDFDVRDGAGNPVPFEVEEDGGFTAVLTGDDRFVHGVTTYVISYTMSDVILAREDGSADEFYWDLIDFEHLQPIAAFSASVTFEEPLASSLNGNALCHAGAPNATGGCEVTRAAQDPATWAIAPMPIAPQNGVTVAIGLEPGAVTQPPARLPNFALDVVPFIVAGAALALGGASFTAALLLKRRRRTARGVIVAQYGVPADLPPLLAAPIAGTLKPAAPAEIVHLAVAGAIRIESAAQQAENRGLFAKKPRPVLRLVDPARAADQLDQSMLRKIFGKQGLGAAFTVPKNDSAFSKKMELLHAEGKKAATERGYFTRAHSTAGRAIGVVGIVLSAAAIAFDIAALIIRESPLPLFAIIAGGGALAVSVLGTVAQRVHTQHGAEAREHLLGVREFIRVAEADRIRMLQSHTGAERVADGEVDVIQLYERLLPYAMLFGLEKEWTRVLEVQYSEQAGYSPYWMAGLGIAGLSNFSSTISDFTSALTSAVSYTSSSSGGSTGGGFAGGGGGGGFSGGR